MALRTLRLFGDDILYKKSKPVRNFDAKLHDLLEDMWDTIYEYDGIGLAAVQVGTLRRIVLLRLPENDDNPEEECYELLNPEILETEGESLHDGEACLSVPGKAGKVLRPDRIKISACDRDGEAFEVEFEDTLATVLSHELDHLDGVLFLDKAESVWDRKPEDEERESSQSKSNPSKSSKGKKR